MEMLATILGLPNDPTLTWDHEKNNSPDPCPEGEERVNGECVPVCPDDQ